MRPARKALMEKYGTCRGTVVRSAAGRAWLDSLDETTRRVWLNLNRLHRRNGIYGHHGGYEVVMRIRPEKTVASAIVTGATVRRKLVAEWLEMFARSDAAPLAQRKKRGAPIGVARPATVRPEWRALPMESKPRVERMMQIAAKVRVA